MKKIQLLSVVFSLIIFTGITAGTVIAFAESDDDDHDFDDRLEYFCKMTGEEKKQLFMDHPRLEQFEERLANLCELDEMEREDLIDEFIDEHFPNYVEKDDWDMDDMWDKYCEMSDEDKETFLEKHPMTFDHQEKMEEYCLLDESEKDAYFEEHMDAYLKHEYDMREKLDEYCEMSDEDKETFLEKHPMTSDHQEKMEEYCLLDDLERDAYIEENKDEFMRDHDSKKFDYNKREKMDEFCEMSEQEKLEFIEEHQKKVDHLLEMEKYCSLDDSGRDMFIEEHMMYMKSQMSDHKDSMKSQMSDHKDSMKSQMSDHKDSMKSQMSDHKDSMISDRKSHMILRASTLTDEQKIEIKTLHGELRDFKHSLRDKSMSDLEKQEMRDHFMEKAREFSMSWISPRHQVAAGIDATMVECREGFTLVMKTSNATPICVKETTAEKLIERGIVISSI